MQSLPFPEENIKTVQIRYSPVGLKITPETIVLEQGENLLFDFHINIRIPIANYRFEIYFDKENPFEYSDVLNYLFNMDKKESRSLEKKLNMGKSETLGDHKYGVRIYKNRDREPLEDVDPIIRIISKIEGPIQSDEEWHIQ